MKLGRIEVPTEELGDTWQLAGVLYDNGHKVIELALPFSKIDNLPVVYTEPTETEWQQFLAQTDDPVTPIGKAFVRKASRQLDQAVVWKCYQRDNYTCVYCGATGVPLTYDHYLAQAHGGQTTIENGRTSCRPCNKVKGHMTIAEWQAYAQQRGLHDGATAIHTS